MFYLFKLQDNIKTFFNRHNLLFKIMISPFVFLLTIVCLLGFCLASTLILTIMTGGGTLLFSGGIQLLIFGQYVEDYSLFIIWFCTGPIIMLLIGCIEQSIQYYDRKREEYVSL